MAAPRWSGIFLCKRRAKRFKPLAASFDMLEMLGWLAITFGVAVLIAFGWAIVEKLLGKGPHRKT